MPCSFLFFRPISTAGSETVRFHEKLDLLGLDVTDVYSQLVTVTLWVGLLVLFGWISNLLGRKGAFILYHVVAFFMVLLLFNVLIANQASALTLAITLPVVIHVLGELASQYLPMLPQH